jgi:hypothetical protein
MELQDRVAALEESLTEMRAHQVVMLAEIEALMFCVVAALRCAPRATALRELTQQIEKLQAMTLACPTPDDIEQVRTSKAQQVYKLVSAAIRQPELEV